MTRFLETRKGFTLTEVLMAMFVMAIGMLSLLALFPVAFQNAKWALDTEQVARGAANAQSTTELPNVPVGGQLIAGNWISEVSNTSHSVRNDSRYKPTLTNPKLNWRLPPAIDLSGLIGRHDYLVDSVNNTWTFEPNIYTPPPPPNPSLPLGLPNARVKLPPVFVDPQVADTPTFINGTLANVPFHAGLPFQLGADEPAFVPFRHNGGTPQVINTIAALRPQWSVGIPRVSSSQYTIDPDPSGLRKQNETTMGDEIDFASNGQPNINAAGSFARQRRFTWAYMCHWPEYSNSDICEVTAVVFNSRPTNSGLATLPPGEKTYVGNVAAAAAAGTDVAGFGRIFVKGLNQATIFLGAAPTPMSLKANDWILDSTLILPEYNETLPALRVPFLDEYNPNAFYTFTLPGPTTVTLRPGLVGGHFYKVLDISEVRNIGGVYFQTITLDRPAKSDGFSATVMSGIADVITKGAGKMPQR